MYQSICAQTDSLWSIVNEMPPKCFQLYDVKKSIYQHVQQYVFELKKIACKHLTLLMHAKIVSLKSFHN